MKRLVQTLLVGVLLATGSSAWAGGPVLIEEGNPEVIEEAPAARVGSLPILLGVVLLCAVVCGGGGGSAGGTGGDGDGGGDGGGDGDPKL